jgi:hypothetical protein
MRGSRLRAPRNSSATAFRSPLEGFGAIVNLDTEIDGCDNVCYHADNGKCVSVRRFICGSFNVVRYVRAFGRQSKG